VDDRVHVDIANILDTQERVLCFAIYTRRSHLSEKERERMSEKKKIHADDIKRMSKEYCSVKLEPTLSCISPKHRDPRGRARGSAPEDMQQSPLMTPKSSCRVPLLQGREHCYLGKGGGVFLSIALVTHYTPVLETKGRRTRGFVKMKMKRYREKKRKRESLELKGTDLKPQPRSFHSLRI